MSEVRERIEYKPSDVIFSEGDNAMSMYIIESGKVEISKDINGQKKVLSILEKGKIFGEIALIEDGPRTATATSIDNTVCIKVPKNQFIENFEKSSPFIKALIKILIDNIKKSS
jgi:CRP/FNR family transcriptional regulator, cyclic AMP receptor protein